MIVLQDRLTRIEAKLAVVVEYQERFLSLALTQRATPNQAPSVPTAAEQSTYGAAQTYDALLYRQQFGQPIGVSLPAQPSCFMAYPNSGITTNYLLSSGNLEQRLPQESDGYAGEQGFYNGEEYQDNGLGYEIPPNYLPLSSQELFLSGGDAARSATAAPILPGFFSSSVKQCLSDKTPGGRAEAAVAQSAALNLIMVSSASTGSDVSAGQTVTSTLKSTFVAVSSIPSVPQNTQTSPLAAPKFVPSTTTVAATTTVSVPSGSEAKLSDGNKTLFGGFSFTTAPPVQVDKSQDEKKAADKAVSKAENPFANFSFSSLAVSIAGDRADADGVISKPKFGVSDSFCTSTPASSIAASDKSTASQLPVFGAGATTFADLAKQDVKGFTTKVDNSDVFKAAGEELFRHTFVKSPGSTGKANVSGQEDEEEYVPDQEFKPLVSLPEVEVKTGEEDEEKLFGERAKLYRMDADSRQWKERGIGEIKILHHRISGRFRIVMRREQVLKLCANHYITTRMTLVPLKTSETSLCWVASDYSEGEVQKEQLCIKFKTADIAQKFRSCFEDCQLRCCQQVTGQEPSSAASAPAEATSTNNLPLSELFKPKRGQWVCNGCYITNESSKVTCIACMAPKPGVAPVTMEQPSVSSTTDKPLSSIFQAKPGEWECATCYVRNTADKTACAACETSKPGAVVTTDSSALTKSESAFKIAPTGGFTFSAISGKPFTFGGTAFTTSSSSGNSSSSSQSTSVTTAVSSSLSGFVMPFSFEPSSTVAAAFSASSITAPTVFSFGTPQSGKSGTPVKPVFQSLGKPSVASSVTVFQSSSSTPSFPSLSSALESDKAACLKREESKAVFGSPGFVFEGVKPVSSLSSLMNAGTASPFVFSSPSPATPQQPALSPHSPQSPDNELYETAADDEPNVSFEPVVQLPDNEEVKTGEEDEDLVYSQRAKLYRFVDSEWKERGIGDVKLLQHRTTGAGRIIMRRERVLKLCLNHRVSTALVLQPMPNALGKAWTWHADDFSDGSEPAHETFSIRFKNEDVAAEFKQAFDRVKNSEELPAVVVSGSDNEKAPECPGPSILQELLTDDSSQYQGKVAC